MSKIISRHSTKKATAPSRSSQRSGPRLISCAATLDAADSFHRDLDKDLRADYVLANPPFNHSDSFRKATTCAGSFGVPPKPNANSSWVQHFIRHLAPQVTASFVFENGSMPPTKLAYV